MGGGPPVSEKLIAGPDIIISDVKSISFRRHYIAACKTLLAIGIVNEVAVF